MRLLDFDESWRPCRRTNWISDPTNGPGQRGSWPGPSWMSYPCLPTFSGLGKPSGSHERPRQLWTKCWQPTTELPNSSGENSRNQTMADGTMGLDGCTPRDSSSGRPRFAGWPGDISSTSSTIEVSSVSTSGRWEDGCPKSTGRQAISPTPEDIRSTGPSPVPPARATRQLHRPAPPTLWPRCHRRGRSRNHLTNIRATTEDDPTDSRRRAVHRSSVGSFPSWRAHR